ncbi:hypothetical protein KVO79_00005, partial [Serratia quinivorans]|nr:hypothetical protein [Serratia quinivorans]
CVNWYIFVMVSCTRKKTTMKTMRKLDTEDGSYDPIGTLSLITCFVSSLGPLERPLSFPATHHKQASLRFKSLSLHFFDASRTKIVRNI